MADDDETRAPAVVVTEPPLPSTVRRPRDLLRLAVGVLLAALLLVTAVLAVTTTSGLEQDLIGVVTGLPGIVLGVVQFLGVVGLLVIPLAVSLDLLVRRRPAQMVTALVAATIAAFVAFGLRLVVETVEPGRVLEALTKVTTTGQRTLPLDASLAAVVALLAVAQLAGRPRWQAASGIVVVSVAATLVLSSTLTLVAAVESVLLGWIVGLTVRYARGTPTERPDGATVAAALADAGLPLATLTRGVDPARRRRRYAATTADGSAFRVEVLDRDQEGAGLLSALWRQVRVIGPAARPAYLTLRREFEHEALVTYAAMTTGAAVVPLAAVTEVGPYAAALAYPADPDWQTLDVVDDAAALPDAVLDAWWSTLDRLHRARIAHRGLSARRLQVGPDGTGRIAGFRLGEVAASDFALSIDIAELLTTTGATVGVDRAVEAAERTIGRDRLVRALPLLQPLSMSRTTRRMLRGRKELLKELRARIVELTPEEPVAEQSIRRFRPRTVLSAVGLAVAAYFFITQIGSIDVGGLISQADWRWALAALVFSVLTYLGAALSIIGFTPERLRVLPTMAVQVAATYFSLFAPGVVSGVAVNTTYLQRSGVYAGVAVASVGVSQLSAVIASAMMLLVFGALAGTGPQASFTPSEGVILAVGVVVLVLVLAVSIGPVRRYALARIRPVFARVIPRLLDVLQNPRALITGFGGNLLMNLAYIGALYAATEAFGDAPPLPALALVFLAGSAVASAFPTPGGVGAVELALTTSLTAAGVDGATALSAVLLYRICTFWIPVPLGWLSQNWLSRRGLLFTG